MRMTWRSDSWVGELSPSLGTPGVYDDPPKDCPELLTTSATVQQGYKETYDHLGISERKELHLSLKPRAWSAEFLDSMRQHQMEVLRGVAAAQKRSRPGGVPCADAPPPKKRKPPELQYVLPETKHEWLQELADEETPLRQLEACLPYGNGCAQVLWDLCAYRPPLHRAVWLLKVVYTNLIKPSEAESAAEQEAGQRCQLLTRNFTEYLASQLPNLSQSFSEVDAKAMLGSTVNVRGLGRFVGSRCGAPGSAWNYATSLIGWSYREGLISIGVLLPWMLGQLKSDSAGGVATMALLPLLHLLLPDVKMAQQQVQAVVDLCLSRCGGNQQAGQGRGQGRGKPRLEACFREVLAELISMAAHHFVGLDTVDGLELPVQILEHRASLASTVQARVLGFDPAAIMQMLDDRMKEGAVDAAMAGLATAVAPWLRKDNLDAAVSLVCRWASFQPASGWSHAPRAETLPRRPCTWNRLIFGRRMLQKAASEGAFGAAPPPIGGDHCPPLQKPLLAWLESWPEAKQATSRSRAQSFAFLLELTEAGVFCPWAYLRTLVARGKLPPSPTAGPAELAVATVHAGVLNELPPELVAPLLREPLPPTTPGGEEPDPPYTGWNPSVQLYAHTREALLRRCAGKLRKATMEGCTGGPQPPPHDERLKSLDRVASLKSSVVSRDSSPGESSGVSGAPFPRSASVTPTPGSSVEPQSRLHLGLDGVQAAVRGGALLPEVATADAELFDAVQVLSASQHRRLVGWMSEEGSRQLSLQQQSARFLAMLQRLVALLECAGGGLDSLEILLRQLPSCLLPSSHTSWLEAALCAMLAARMETVVCAGVGCKLLEACTSWALTSSSPKPHVNPDRPCVLLAINCINRHRGNSEVQAWWAALLARKPRPPIVAAMHARVANLARSPPGNSLSLFDPSLGCPNPSAEQRGGVIPDQSAIEAAINAYVSEPRDFAASALVEAMLPCVGNAAQLGGGVRCLLQRAAAGVGVSETVLDDTQGVVHVLLLLRGRAGTFRMATALSQAIAEACVILQMAHPLKALLAAGLADPLHCCKTAVQYFRGDPPGGAAWFQALWAGSNGCPEAEAWEATMQLRQLPAAAIWEVLQPQLLACRGDGNAVTWLEDLLGQEWVREAFLRDTQYTRKMLSAWERGPPESPFHLTSVLAQFLLCGSLETPPCSGSGADSLAFLEGQAAKMLASAKPELQPLLTTLLRTNLDDQIYLAGLEKGMGAGNAGSRARRAVQDAQQGAAHITEEEKSLTSRVLAELMVNPREAPGLARLTWALGRGLGEYLLQQTDWVLQDADTLMGNQTLLSVLMRRFGALLPQGREACNPPGAWRLETAFCEVCLTCLSCSQEAHRRSFADQLVSQLKRLGDSLKLHPPDPAPAREPHLPPVEEAAQGASQPGRDPRPPGSPDRSNAPRKPAVSSPFGAGKARRLSMQAMAVPGSPAGVQCAVWLRLGVLPALLPLVYLDREPHAPKNLRPQLAAALFTLLCSAHMTPPSGRPLREEGRQFAEGLAAAEGEGGAPLFDRLLEVMHALICGQWASWLRGSKANLREVAALDTRSMQHELASASAPARVKALIQSALTSLPSPTLAAALRRPGPHPQPPAPPPWQLPDWEANLRAACGVREQGAGGLPPLLQGSKEVQQDWVL